MSSGGSDKSVTSQVGDALNQVSNFVYAYNPSNGKFGDKGSFVDWADEGLGYLNGSNAARHAAGVAGDAVNQAKVEQGQLIQKQQLQKQQMDINASNSAAGIRATAAAQSSMAFNPQSTTPFAFGSKLGAGGQDFLGL